ncbi:MAG: cob(I)yrinic acid a,c-diamide adenosyltransferase [Clostridia bacterium]|jgi:cob(I)alamin adenosyltransferase|nr:cob(I)yrinic acid a,c-diamide adenosyltransferase [Clostridia bacterium]
MEKGFVQIYTGNGKGKTTAAMGLAVRACGRGLRVVIVQFLKGSSTGEMKVLEGINGVKLIRVANADKFFWKLTDDEKEQMKRVAEAVLLDIETLFEKNEVDVLILDEVMGAMKNGIVTMKQIFALLDIRPKQVEVVLSGRDAPKELIDRADLVTEMQDVKHYFSKGVKAREGIEY